jgi:hypothetical protein
MRDGYHREGETLVTTDEQNWDKNTKAIVWTLLCWNSLVMLIPKQQTLTVTIPIICMTNFTVRRHIWPREKDYHLEQDVFIFPFTNNTISINLVASIFSALLLQEQLVSCNLFFNLQSKRRNFSYIKRSCLLLTVMIKPQSPHEPVLQPHNCKEQHNQQSIPRSISSS